MFFFETFDDLDELLLAARAARSLCDLPIVAHITCDEDGRTVLGHTPEGVALSLSAAGVDVAGANCSLGPAAVTAVVERMHQAAPHSGPLRLT